MATVYNIEFTPTPGSWGTLIEYRKSPSITWIVPNSPANPTTLTSYPLTLDDDSVYYIRVSANGLNCTKKYVILTVETGAGDVWVADTSYCEESMPLNLVDSITGFADPNNIAYDATTGDMFVVDGSALTQGSNVYRFNPNTITSPADVTPLGSINVAALASIIDITDRKIYITGPNTSGLITYNMATNAVSSLAFGSNLAYGRLVLLKSGTTLLSLDDKSLLLTLVNTTTNTIISSTPYSSIPSYNLYFSGAPVVVPVGSEWWVMNSQGAVFGIPDGKIARYNSSFSALLGTITLPGVATWTNGAYWRTAKLLGTDLLVYDAGSNQLLKVNTGTQVVSSIYTFTNREGKSNSLLSVIQDPISNDLFVSGVWSNNANTDVNPIQITYKLNPTTYVPDTIYPAIAYGTNLTRVGLTDQLIGVFANVPVYPSNPVGAATDGQINIFSKSIGSNNTGYVIVLTLKNLSTGDIKPNSPSDPDYIPKYLDTTACPIVYDLICPEATHTAGLYEYSLKPSTYSNPVLDHIDLVQVDTVTSGTLATTTVPKNLFQQGTLTKVGSNPNRVDLLFKNAANATIGTCTNIFTF